MVAQTKFGYVVKAKLLEIGKTQQWLYAEVKARTGLYLDSGYLHKILTNQREAVNVRNAIIDILDISEDEIREDEIREEDEKAEVK